MYYLLYWAVVLSLLAWKWWTGTLTDRKEAQVGTCCSAQPVLA